MATDTHVYPVQWNGDHLLLIDQRQLPERYQVVTIHRWEDVVQALQVGIVQGGSALGIATAYGLYLAAQQINTQDPLVLWQRLQAIAAEFERTRPQKASIGWAVQQMLGSNCHPEAPLPELRSQLLAQAQALQQQDFDLCHRIGDHGLAVLPEQPQQLTLFYPL